MATKKSTGATLTGTLTDIYEVPANKRAEWILVYVTNTSGSTETFNITYYDASQSASLFCAPASCWPRLVTWGVDNCQTECCQNVAKGLREVKTSLGRWLNW